VPDGATGAIANCAESPSPTPESHGFLETLLNSRRQESEAVGHPLSSGPHRFRPDSSERAPVSYTTTCNYRVGRPALLAGLGLPVESPCTQTGHVSALLSVDLAPGTQAQPSGVRVRHSESLPSDAARVLPVLAPVRLSANALISGLGMVVVPANVVLSRFEPGLIMR
jgi:hypothetical protein